MSFLDWMSGHLSTSQRVWSALAPLFVVLAYALGGLGILGLRALRGDPFHDEEMDTKGEGALFSRRIRHVFAFLMRPFWKVLARAAVPPNAITSLSLGLAIAAGVACAAGRFSLGGWLFVAGGLLDFVDGRVARATGRASAQGAALDSILDRYADSALIVGLAWYYRATPALVAALAALTGSLFVPYVRARGEALGVKMANVGLFQRGERIAVLGLTTALAPVPDAILWPHQAHPWHWLSLAGLVLVGASSHFTAVHRLFHLRRALAEEPSPESSGEITVPRRFGKEAIGAAAANGVATAVDFALFAFLIKHVEVAAPAATAAASTAGAIVSFVTMRALVFASGKGSAAVPQAARYALVSVTTAALNTGAVFVLLLLPGMPAVLAWALARASVFLLWSMPMYREYVFATNTRGSTVDRTVDTSVDERGVSP